MVTMVMMTVVRRVMTSTRSWRSGRRRRVSRHSVVLELNVGRHVATRQERAEMSWANRLRGGGHGRGRERRRRRETHGRRERPVATMMMMVMNGCGGRQRRRLYETREERGRGRRREWLAVGGAATAQVKVGVEALAAHRGRRGAGRVGQKEILDTGVTVVCCFKEQHVVVVVAGAASKRRCLLSHR